MKNGHEPTPEELLHIQRRMQQSGMDEQSRQQELLRFAGQKLDAKQQQTLKQILQDKDAMQKLLQSEQAQKLLQRLKNKP